MPAEDAAIRLRDLLDRMEAACDAEGRDPSTVRLVATANLSDPPSHYELLAELGIDDVDVMLTQPEELDLKLAGEFIDRVARGLS